MDFLRLYRCNRVLQVPSGLRFPAAMLDAVAEATARAAATARSGSGPGTGMYVVVVKEDPPTADSGSGSGSGSGAGAGAGSAAKSEALFRVEKATRDLVLANELAMAAFRDLWATVSTESRVSEDQEGKGSVLRWRLEGADGRLHVTAALPGGQGSVAAWVEGATVATRTT